jgi:hypothetical protein
VISYHIVASVSLAQREDLVREAERRRMAREGRTVRRRVLREARVQHPRLAPATPGATEISANNVPGALGPARREPGRPWLIWLARKLRIREELCPEGP